MASNREIDNSNQRCSIDTNFVHTNHLSEEINWRIATELPPLPQYKFSHNLTLFETNQVEVGNMKLSMSCSSEKGAGSQVEKFVSANDGSAVSYQRLDRSKSELESHLGRPLQPGEQAWSVCGGGIGKSNGFSDKEFIGKVTYDAAKNAVVVDVSYPVKQRIVYNSDGSSEHSFANGVKTFTPAKRGDTHQHHTTLDGPEHQDVVVQSSPGHRVDTNQLSYRFSPQYRFLPQYKFSLPPVVIENRSEQPHGRLRTNGLNIDIDL